MSPTQPARSDTPLGMDSSIRPRACSGLSEEPGVGGRSRAQLASNSRHAQLPALIRIRESMAYRPCTLAPPSIALYDFAFLFKDLCGCVRVSLGPADIPDTAPWLDIIPAQP